MVAHTQHTPGSEGGLAFTEESEEVAPQSFKEVKTVMRRKKVEPPPT